METLPRLEAERGIDRVMQTAAGTGSMEDRDQRNYMQALRRTATAGQVKPEKASAASLAAIGIEVETVEDTEGGEEPSLSS